MSQYTKGFKLDSLTYLKKLKKNGYTYVDGVEVKNVRDLCSVLGISSYTLYNWKKDLGDIDEATLDFQYDKQERESKFIDLSEEEPSKSEIERKVQKRLLEIMSDYRHTMAEAKDLGIPKSTSTSHKQLQLLIGLKWIELSGLVDMKQIREGFKLE